MTKRIKIPAAKPNVCYVRKRVAGKQTSTYVGVYTEELYNLLLRNAREAREIHRELRSVEKQLAAAGYSEDALPADDAINIAIWLCLYCMKTQFFWMGINGRLSFCESLSDCPWRGLPGDSRKSCAGI